MAPYPPEIEQYVQQKVLSGQFRSREELEVKALRVYRDLETKHAQLKADVRAAIDESGRGLSLPLDIEAINAELIAEFGMDRGMNDGPKNECVFRILLTPLGRRDLKETAATENSRSAHGAFFFLHSAANELSKFAALPAAGEVCFDLADDIRRFVIDTYKNQYLVFYRRVAGGIEVLRILDESRDVPAVLRDH